MKKVSLTIVYLIVTLLSSFTNQDVYVESVETIVDKQVVDTIHSTPSTVLDDSIEIVDINNDFFEILAFKESSNNPNAVNGQYLGLYQIGRIAMIDVGLKPISSKEFKKDPSIFPADMQKKVLIKTFKKNLHYMRNYMKKYKDSNINGYKMTITNIVLACHLVGNKSFKKYLSTNGKYIPKDGNNVSIQYYFDMMKCVELKMSDL